MNTGTGLQFIPLIIIQVVLMVLFFVYVRYPSTVPVKVAPGLAPAPATAAQYGVNAFTDIHVMVIIGFGFLMTFLKKYSYGALGFNLMLVALCIQWALLVQNFFHMKDGKIIITKEELVDADVLTIIVLITFGAVLGITGPLQMIFVAVVEIAIGGLNFWLVGDKFQAADVGGAMSIHTFGAFFGLGVSLGMLKKKEPAQTNETPSGGWTRSPPAKVDLNGPSYSSDVTAMIGSLFLWVYWPAINAAATSSDFEYQRAFANTYLSLGASTVTTFFLSGLLTKEKKLDMVLIQNSTLAGGVAAGSVCNMLIGPGVAIAIGFGAGIISVIGYLYITPVLNKKGLIDTCGVLNLHGMPGVYSGLLSVLFAYCASATDYGNTELHAVFPAMSTDRTSGQQALHQFYALLSTLGISFFPGVVTGLLARWIYPLKDNEKHDDTPNWELPK